ncbi:penicillin-binding transpeptidase domain-containing protein [Leptospira sarikeiensis]|uniref:Penicillin binding protein transpeptidase domain-containing protein n=1 Tax=Leptospira sarikeiensis TaxID=2484943 RepID=A0A4R9KBG3_9LEPT|nr:penicillin-binding transpeptidase domain-containing protein [Leptospira sarikeiensis]TGL63361.1 penicillin binding protein transpeptidase domain-containing protein [Leptospira sarikeiensis]
MFRFSAGKVLTLVTVLLFQILPFSSVLFSNPIIIQPNPDELILISEVSPDRESIAKPRAIGELKFLKQKYSPASTFKTYLVLSLLENGAIDPEEKIECSDKHIPNSPRSLNLREALFYSSNDYFEKIFPKLGKEKLDLTLRKIEYMENGSEWWTDMSGLKHGGKIRLSPEKVHSSWSKIFENGYGFSKQILSDWKQSLFWSECPERAANVYGKTGSWEGSFWFQGAIVRSENNYVIYTILNRSKSGYRTGTIQRFYEIAGCKVPSLE